MEIHFIHCLQGELFIEVKIIFTVQTYLHNPKMILTIANHIVPIVQLANSPLVAREQCLWEHDSIQYCGQCFTQQHTIALHNNTLLRHPKARGPVYTGTKE